MFYKLDNIWHATSIQLKLVVVSKMSTSHNSKTLFKPNLTCIFLSVSVKKTKQSISGDPVCMWKVCCVRRADVHFFPFINASPNLLFSPCHLKGFLLSENVLLFFPSFTRTTFACRNIIGKG